MRRVQFVQHVFAAVLLITAAVDHLSRGGEHRHIVLPLAEILAAVALLVAAAIERIRKTHARVGWFELAGSGMLFVEAIAKTQERHHFAFYVLSFVPPVILLLFGLFDSRLRGALRMEANDDAFILQTRALRRRRVAWAGLKTYEITPERIRFFAEDGRTRAVPLRDVENKAAAVEWAERQFVSRGLSAVQNPPVTSAC